MNNIQIFQNEQFGKVRIAMNESNEPLFCLADVCGVIGIANARNVRSRLEEDDVRQMDTIDSLGRNQQVTFITESGLYDVIIRSDSEKAKPFLQMGYKRSFALNPQTWCIHDQRYT